MPSNAILPAALRLPIAVSMLMLSSCSTTPCAPATAPRPLPPTACQAMCPPVPELTDGSLPGFRRWADDLLNLYHDCRRLQAACASDLEIE